ncbi:acyltransferase [Methylocystis iwaonis]|uniref:acyltransferase family protein n=1 Tax=Methylocystis iwaonis TaxID=2885079 RepID=UPI002E7C4646|nr:acyltransferase [Methylocystis iwaonis]
MTRSTNIDALRGVAILAVILRHYIYDGGSSEWLGLPFVIEQIARFGWAGVDLFFVMSAFLLTRSLLRRRGEEGVALIFYRRRLLRTMPMYLCILAAAAVLAPAFSRPSWLFDNQAPLWVYASFLQNFWLGLGCWRGAFLAPTWSLAAEEHVYLILPLIVLHLPRRDIFRVALAFILLSPLIRLAVIFGVGDTANYAWTICRLDSFGWGMLIALAPCLEPRVKTRLIFGWYVAAVMGVAWLWLQLTSRDLMDSFTITASTVLATGIVAVFATRGPAAHPTLLTRGLAFVGERCFSIYLLHIPVFGLMALAFGRAVPNIVDLFSALSAATAFVATIALATLTYRFVERPFIDYGDRYVTYDAVKAAARPA